MDRKMLIIGSIVAVIAAGIYLYVRQIPHTDPAPATASEGSRGVSIEQYISQNISVLSPIKEKLGGKFYVTAMSAEKGKGLVSYEDGHNAYIADFTYSNSGERGGITVTSFVIRQ